VVMLLVEEELASLALAPDGKVAGLSVRPR
jgi:hypothetical protein